MRSTGKVRLSVLVGLLLGLVGGVVWAQSQQSPSTVRGNRLSRQEYQTYATTNLFTDKAIGNDGFACTSAAAPCFTLQGALNKLPIHLRNNVTITMDAGTYTEAVILNGFVLENSTGQQAVAAPTLSIVGSEVNVTPASGSATGTESAYTAGSSSAQAVFTGSETLDGGAGWTANDFRGQFLVITGGTGAGQTMPIVSNTATALTLATSLSPAPNNTSTYAIRTPGPVITQTSGIPLTIRGLGGSGSVNITDVGLSSTTGRCLGVNSNPTTQVFFTSLRAVSTTGGAVAATRQNRLVSFTTSFLTSSSTSSTVSVGAAVAIASEMTELEMNNSFIRNSSTGNGILFLRGSGPELLTGVSIDATPGATGALIQFNNGFYSPSQNSSLWLRCTAGSAGAGILFTTPPGANINVGTTGILTGTQSIFNIANCATGVSINSPVRFYTVAYFDTVTTAISVSKGGIFSSINTDPTFTGVTTQVSIDGTNYLWTDVSGASPTAITNMTYGSSVQK